MSTAQTWQMHSTSSDATEACANKLGKRLKGGEVIELVSDLGGGKTTFVRGLADGMGSQDRVASPTFTLSREYRSKDLVMYHFDFYRLHEPGIMRHELKEALDNPNGVVVIEWATIVNDVLPKKRFTVMIKATGDTSRELSFSYPDTLNYLMDKLI